MKRKISKVLVLLIVVAFALTGCFNGGNGDITNGDDNGTDEIEVGLENSFTEASDYFTFDYPGDWEIDYQEDDISVVVSSVGFEGNGLDFLDDDTFVQLKVDYNSDQEESEFDGEEEFYVEYGFEDDDLEEWNPFEEMISAEIDLVANEEYTLDGLPAYRVAIKLTDIEIQESGDLTEEEINEIEENLNDLYFEFIAVLHNNQDHFIEYLSSSEAHSENILGAILDSFDFVD